MIRTLFFASLLGGIVALTSASAGAETPEPVPVPPPPVDFNALPWTDGETLTYLVSMDSLEAAQGTFVAKKKNDHWEFNLALASRGLVNEVYPFTGWFWTILAPPPWRSVEYGEYRFEPNRTIKEQTFIDYAKHQGTRQIWSQGQTHPFPIAEDSVDDLGAMLYHLRAGPWKPGDRRTFFVYESDSEKQGNAECQARETRGFGSWPAQPLLRISVLPGKGTHHRGGLTLWMTDDARHLPLHADLDFRYGTFSIDLTKADKTLSIVH
jgi:hypothetical protein